MPGSRHQHQSHERQQDEPVELSNAHQPGDDAQQGHAANFDALLPQMYQHQDAKATQEGDEIVVVDGGADQDELRVEGQDDRGNCRLSSALRAGAQGEDISAHHRCCSRDRRQQANQMGSQDRAAVGESF